MNGRALRLCIILLAGCGASAFRIDVARRAKQRAAQKQLVEAKLNEEAMVLAKQTMSTGIDGQTLTQIVSTLVGIATSFVSAFTEDPPDLDYALNALRMQGWKVIELVVPDEHHETPEFDKAERAWRAVLENAAGDLHNLLDAVNREDTRAIVDEVLRTVNTALNAVAEAIPEDGDLILAIKDLVQGMADHVLEFVTDMGWLLASGSFLQIEQSGQLLTKMEPAKLTKLLNAVLGMFTTFVDAFSEDPPALEHAFQTMNLQGWEIVKLLVPEEDQLSDDFNNARKAWDRAFADAPNNVENIVRAWKEGDIGAIVKGILTTVETALKTAAEVANPDDAKILNGVAKLLVGLGDEWIRFSGRIGLDEPVDLSPIDGGKLTQIVNTAISIATSVITAFSQDPPDIKYAFDAMSIQGWKLIKLIVPEEHHSEPDFDTASRAWKAVFAGVETNFDKLLDAVEREDTRAIVDEVLRAVYSALEAVAEAIPEDGDLILAIKDLVQGMADSVLEFTTTMGWLDAPGSFVQVVQSDQLMTTMDPGTITQLLTTAVGLFTTFVAAFSEDPPDLDYAFASTRITGWKMIRLIVPAEDQLSDGFKNSRTEWNSFFYDAPELTEVILDAWNAGDTAGVIKSTLAAIEAALKAGARAARHYESEDSAETAKILDGVAKLSVSLGDEWITFSGRVGWLP